LTSEVGLYYANILGRALAGKRDKKFVFGLGPRDCGKSKFSMALERSIGGYYGTFSGESFLVNKYSSQEEAQRNRPFLNKKYCRIIVSNEVTNTGVFNVESLKKHSSGGDALEGRFHGGLEQSFEPHYLPVLNANGLPGFSENDPAFMIGRLAVIPYTKKYAANPQENELQIDENINEEINTEAFQRAFVHVLIEGYNNPLTEVPKACEAGKEKYIENDRVVESFFEQYVVTGKESDFTSNEDFKMFLDVLKEESRDKMPTPTMLILKINNSHSGKEMMRHSKTIDGRTRRGYKGVRVKRLGEC